MKVVVEVVLNILNVVLFGYLKKKEESPLEKEESVIHEEEINLSSHLAYLQKQGTSFGLGISVARDQDNEELYEIKDVKSGKLLAFYRTPIEVSSYIDGYEDGGKK